LIGLINGVVKASTKQVSGHHLDWFETWMKLQPLCKNRCLIGWVLHHLHGKVEKQAARTKCGWNADLTLN